MVFEFYNEIRNLPRTPEDDLLNILALKSQVVVFEIRINNFLILILKYQVYNIVLWLKMFVILFIKLSLV